MHMQKHRKNEKETDTEFLARLMAENFERTSAEISSVKEEISSVKEETSSLKSDMSSLRTEMNERFDRIENILYRGHENRIEKLEDKIAQIQVILGKKLA